MTQDIQWNVWTLRSGEVRLFISMCLTLDQRFQAVWHFLWILSTLIYFRWVPCISNHYFQILADPLSTHSPLNLKKKLLLTNNKRKGKKSEHLCQKKKKSIHLTYKIIFWFLGVQIISRSKIWTSSFLRFVNMYKNWALPHSIISFHYFHCSKLHRCLTFHCILQEGVMKGYIPHAMEMLYQTLRPIDGLKKYINILLQTILPYNLRRQWVLCIFEW